MKKIALLSTLILILVTSLVKNSTKKNEDLIFTINENIRSLRTELGTVKLEYDYLSSPEKLIQYQNKYFENHLVKVDIMRVKEISKKNNIIKITDLTTKLPVNE
jgi:hypothetical protein